MSTKTILSSIVALPLALLLGCGGSSSSGGGGTTAIFATKGGSLTTGTGNISVKVVDACSGEPLANALVWIDSDVLAAVSTDANGNALLTSVAGSANERMISAGKVDYSLASILTTATSVCVGLVRTDRTGGGETTTISGTVTFLGSQSNAEVFVIDSDDCEAGFSSATATNVAGSGAYSITVPTGRPLIVAVASYDNNGTLTALTSTHLNAQSSALTNLNFTLGDEEVPEDLTAGTVTSIPSGHDQGFTGASGELVWGGLDLSGLGFVPVAGSATITGFELPSTNLQAAIQATGVTPLLEVFTQDTSTGQFTFRLSSLNLNAAAYPGATLNNNALTITITGTDTTPTVGLSSSLSAGSGFHVVTFENQVSGNKFRCWTFIVDGDTTSFEVPAVPASLSDDGLVVGQSYFVDAEAFSIVVTDFDNFAFSNIFEATTQTGFGDSTSYTPN